jgi:hypothetical protein
MERSFKCRVKSYELRMTNDEFGNTPCAMLYALYELWEEWDDIEAPGFGISQHNIHVLNSFA